MSSDNTYGFSGAIPPGVSIQANIDRAFAYQQTHSVEETITWFNDTVRSNRDGHLSPELSMDYKQLDRATRAPGTESLYADFGNFNYGAVGRALGFSDEMLGYAAGFQQQIDDGKGQLEAIFNPDYPLAVFT
jgi:hypothetical protein